MWKLKFKFCNIAVAHSEKVIKCPKCEKCFGSERSLNDHKRVVHMKTLKCTECSFSCRSKHAMELHVKC